MQVTFLFKLGLGLGHELKSGPLLLLIKNLYSDRQRVGKTLVYASNGESVKKSGSIKVLLMTLTMTHVESR
jgi:hypothetical protein